jgi:hypothetical protein
MARSKPPDLSKPDGVRKRVRPRDRAPDAPGPPPGPPPAALSSAQLAAILARLGLDRPILAHRVVGSRVELFPLGGGRLIASLEEEPGAPVWDPAWDPASEPQLGPLLRYLESHEDGPGGLSRDELYAIARRLKLRGRSRLDRRQLRRALIAHIQRLYKEGGPT